MLYQSYVDATDCDNWNAQMHTALRDAWSRYLRESAARGNPPRVYLYSRTAPGCIDLRFAVECDPRDPREEGFDIVLPEQVFRGHETVDQAIARLMPILRRCPLMPIQDRH